MNLDMQFQRGKVRSVLEQLFKMKQKRHLPGLLYTMTSAKLHEEIHLQVLRLLQGNPRLSQREVSNALGMGRSKTNFCIKALVDKGSIKVKSFRKSQNKLADAYLLTPSGLAEKSALTARFLKRKMAEYEQLHSEIAVLQRDANDEQSSELGKP